MFPRRREAGRGVWIQGPHHRETARAGRRSGRGSRRAGPVPAEREGIALRERLSDGARRWSDQRNGDGSAATGGGALTGSHMLQVISLLLENKPGALLRVTG